MSKRVVPTEALPEEPSILIPQISDETRNEVRQRAVSKIERDPTHSVFPVSAPKLRRVLIDAKNNAIGEVEGKSRSEALQNIPEQELIERAQGYLYGKWFEGFSNTVELNEANTVFVGSDVDKNLFENAKVETTASSLFTNRKDHALMILYAESVSETGKNSSEQTENIIDNEEDRKAIASRVKDFIQSSNQILTEWRKEKKEENFANVDMQTLLDDWWTKATKTGLIAERFGEKGKEYAAACLNEALEITKHEKGSNDYYFEYTLPDSFVQAENGEVIAPIEVKAYTEQEIKLWIKGLKETAEDMRKLPTMVTKQNVKGMEMKLGVDPTAELRFIELMNHVRMSGENGESFENYYEKLATMDPETQPIVLRLTEDVSDETVQELGKACEKLGFTNMVIQKLPFTREELGISAQYFCEKNLEKVLDRKKVGYAVSPKDKRIYQALAKKETWAEKE